MASANRPPPGNGAASERRLAAVLHADIAGYSRLMGDDESGTLARLKACRGVMDDIIAGHGGRVVGSAGDAVLAEFASVSEALSAAVEVQAALGERNAELPQDRRLEFRIGINLGDVIVDGDDIFGTGVNVAARVEALADPGAIAVSGSVYDQVSAMPGLVFEDRGTHRVKNIAQPIRVYAVGSADGGPLPRQARRARRGRIALAAAGVVAAAALLVAGAALYWPAGLPWAGGRQPAAGAPPAVVAELGKPTLAVLPFEDRVGDPEKAYFSDGLTEDVIIELGRFSGLLVLSWSAVAPYKGKAVEPAQLRDDLHADYVVSGSVRRAAERLRVTVQLTDIENGVLLWSERYDREIGEIFAVQDEITREVVAALAVKVTHLEEGRAFDKPTGNLSAYDLVLRGRALLRRPERQENFDARDLFEQAIAIDHQYADAYVGLGWTHMNDFFYGWTERPRQSLDRSEELASKAISLDDRNAPAHALYAQVLRIWQRYEEAERAIDRAIELNPSNAMSHAIRGTLLSWWGRPREAIDAIEFALRLDPYPHQWWLVNLAQSYYFLGEYREAIHVFERYAGSFEDDPMPYAIIAAAHAELGQMDEASQAVARLEHISPFFRPEIYTSHLANPEHGKQLLEGLAKAGFD